MRFAFKGRAKIGLFFGFFQIFFYDLFLSCKGNTFIAIYKHFAAFFLFIFKKVFWGKFWVVEHRGNDPSATLRVQLSEQDYGIWGFSGFFRAYLLIRRLKPSAIDFD